MIFKASRRVLYHLMCPTCHESRIHHCSLLCTQGSGTRAVLVVQGRAWLLRKGFQLHREEVVPLLLLPSGSELLKSSAKLCSLCSAALRTHTHTAVFACDTVFGQPCVSVILIYHGEEHRGIPSNTEGQIKISVPVSLLQYRFRC